MILDNRSDNEIIWGIEKALRESETVSIGPFNVITEHFGIKEYVKTLKGYGYRVNFEKVSLLTVNIVIDDRWENF